jgi:NADPH-dependent glutamate synthase beta subunit-like oxidoreductase
LIPCSRYESAVEEIDAILKPARAAGRIEIRLESALGHDFSLDQLQSQFDAVFLGLGLEQSISLATADGVLDALGFLRDVKRGKITSLCGRVAVIGGGNTAVDAAVAAKQLGAADVFVVYRRSAAEMPAWPEEQKRLRKTGCHLLILTQPLGYETDAKGRVVGVRVARTELGERDASGRRAPRTVPGSDYILPVELVIEAIGQALPDAVRSALEGVALTRHGLVATRPGSQATSLERVFAGGDLVNGGTTAVQAIAEGMKAADEIDRTLPAQRSGERTPPNP